MEEQNEKERLKLCVERYDHYYDSINNKSAVFLTLSTFITGGLVAAYPTLLERVNCGTCIHFLMIILLSLGLAIIILVAWTSTPFIGKQKHSLLYFGGIAQSSIENFKQRSATRTPEDELNDMRTQVHELAMGLYRKFRKLRTAGILLIIQFFLFIPLIAFIIINLKSKQ